MYLYACKQADHLAMEAQQGCPPGIACVIDIAREYKAKGVPIACATSGLKDHVDVHLKHAGIYELFEVQKSLSPLSFYHSKRRVFVLTIPVL
jgi:phosphoglycolate phosphatase-like HAD superfamily hydrolase